MEIRRSDAIMSSKPLVSVCCATYNQASYIGRALDSMLAQRADFAFEVLVHDDASTDGTADLVARYGRQHPDIVRPVLQTENQYSRLPIIIPRFLFPRARGDFVALCEGDDFWLDPNKLRRQVRAMEACPECDMSFHPALSVDPDGRTGPASPNLGDRPCVLSFPRVLLGGGGYCPTPTIMIRRRILDSISECVERAPFGDKFIQIIGAERGGALFLPQAMAAYRSGHQESWTRTIGSAGRLARYEQLIDPPYEWLETHLPTSRGELLDFSRGDQYVVLSRKYRAIGQADDAARTLAAAAGHFRNAGHLSGPARVAARRQLMLGAFHRMYPLLRSIYRWRTVGPYRAGNNGCPELP